jgi:hypothetical protein
MKTPKPVLKAGVIYSADNGELICLECAGMSAKYTGRYRCGKPVVAMTQADADEWQRLMGRPLTCESGCTTFDPAR